MSEQIELVLDASVIFNLGHRGKLELLWERLSEQRTLVVTPEVKREVTEKPRQDIHYESHIRAWCTEWNEPLFKPHLIHDGLGPGETSVLSLGLRKGWELALDERLARKTAKELGLRMVGTLGLLEQAVKAEWLSGEDAMRGVWNLQRGGFFLPTKPGPNDDFCDYVGRVKEALVKREKSNL